MNKRTFTPDELARLFKGQVNEANEGIIDLGGGIKVMQMAKREGLLFQVQRDGKGEHFLKDADAAELAEISEMLWAKYGPFIPDRRDELIPDELKDAPEDTDLEPDPTGLKPDWIRRQEKLEKAEAALSHRDQLIPDEYREKPDPELAARRAAMTPEERHRDDLIPDALKGKDE